MLHEDANGPSEPLSMSSNARTRQDADEHDSEDDQMQHDVDEISQNDYEEGWQRVPLAKKKRPTRNDRVSRSRINLQLRPLAKIRIRRVPRHAIANAIGYTAPSAELAEMAAVTFDDAANSAHIAVYDENHAAKLLRIDRLTFRQDGKPESIEVVIEPLQTYKNTIRGVIQVDPAESNETIMKWVRCEQADILRVQKIGKTDRAVLTFDTSTLPRVVKYYMELVRVAEYRPKRIVCFNCHQLGHMARFCPSPSVCKECGRSHPETDDCADTEFCVACKKTGHLSLSKVCPSRLPKAEEKIIQTKAVHNNPPESGSTSASGLARTGISWASAVTGMNEDNAQSSYSLPPSHPVIVENAQLKKQLQELRNELQNLKKELGSLRKSVHRKQSVSPPPPKNTERRSRSRVSRQKNTLLNPSNSYITEEMLAQREAQLKFQNNKECQKAFSGITALQEQFNSFKEEFQRVAQKMHEFTKMMTPEEDKSRKKQTP